MTASPHLSPDKYFQAAAALPDSPTQSMDEARHSLGEFAF